MYMVITFMRNQVDISLLHTGPFWFWHKPSSLRSFCINMQWSEFFYDKWNEDWVLSISWNGSHNLPPISHSDIARGPVLLNKECGIQQKIEDRRKKNVWSSIPLPIKHFSGLVTNMTVRDPNIPVQRRKFRCPRSREWYVTSGNDPCSIIFCSKFYWRSAWQGKSCTILSGGNFFQPMGLKLSRGKNSMLL